MVFTVAALALVASKIPSLVVRELRLVTGTETPLRFTGAGAAAGTGDALVAESREREMNARRRDLENIVDR